MQWEKSLPGCWFFSCLVSTVDKRATTHIRRGLEFIVLIFKKPKSILWINAWYWVNSRINVKPDQYNQIIVRLFLTKVQKSFLSAFYILDKYCKIYDRSIFIQSKIYAVVSVFLQVLFPQQTSSLQPQPDTANLHFLSGLISSCHTLLRSRLFICRHSFGTTGEGGKNPYNPTAFTLGAASIRTSTNSGEREKPSSIKVWFQSVHSVWR